MSKPDDIDQDVWTAASYAVTSAPEYTEALHEAVACAIMAERAAQRERDAVQLSGPELWEILFATTKGAVPETLTDEVLSETAKAIREAFKCGR